MMLQVSLLKLGYDGGWAESVVRFNYSCLWTGVAFKKRFLWLMVPQSG